jgi:hypothetical protein
MWAKITYKNLKFQAPFIIMHKSINNCHRSIEQVVSHWGEGNKFGVLRVMESSRRVLRFVSRKCVVKA